MQTWTTSRFDIDLSRPLVMGIVNLTPDSFSDGGQHASAHSAIEHAARLVNEGADILDLGAESSRPGAEPVALSDELDRLRPVLREVVGLGVPVSVDTCKPEVMRAALDLGADIVNDIWALRQPSSIGGPDARQVVASHPRCGVVLMHMHRDPRTMQSEPMEGDVLAPVLEFLRRTAGELRTAGVGADRIVLDPGIGFGKTVAQNFSLLARQAELAGLGYPLLAGWSRKSSLAAAMGIRLADMAALHNADRLAPSLAAAVLAVDRGARIVRVHDVRHTVAALGVWQAMRGELSTVAGVSPAPTAMAIGKA